jgi:hypothetical protein
MPEQDAGLLSAIQENGVVKWTLKLKPGWVLVYSQPIIKTHMVPLCNSKRANTTKRTQITFYSAHHLLNSAAVATQDTGTCTAASYGREAPTHAPGLVLDAIVHYLVDARDGLRKLVRLNFDVQAYIR